MSKRHLTWHSEIKFLIPPVASPPPLHKPPPLPSVPMRLSDQGIPWRWGSWFPLSPPTQHSFSIQASVTLYFTSATTSISVKEQAWSTVMFAFCGGDSDGRQRGPWQMLLWSMHTGLETLHPGRGARGGGDTCLLFTSHCLAKFSFLQVKNI